MSEKCIKPISLVVGTALVTSLAATEVLANNTANPFAMNELSGGYMQLADASSANKPAQESGKESKQNMEGKCGEGKCGSKTEMKQNMEGKCGGKKAEQEGKCGGTKK